MSAFCVYLLRYADDGHVFYVGQTANEQRRFRQHLAGECKSTAPAILEAQRQGREVRMQVVARFGSREEAVDHETVLIYRAFCKSYRLCNHQHRAKLSA